MNKHYKIRTATRHDRDKVQQLFIRSVINDKNITSPDLVKASFVDDFVNKIIDQGNMIIVENNSMDVEMIGEVHYYKLSAYDTDDYFKELVFFPGVENDDDENDIIDWLYGEIEQKHSDVFSVDISAPVSSLANILMYRKKGINIEGNFESRLNSKSRNQKKVMLPMKWINPSFN
jgi:hypothetical protein